MDVEKIRKEFPILGKKINGKPLVYLDNAATTQKPRQVIDAVSNFYEDQNANIHRGIHTLSRRCTEAYDEAREKIHDFVKAGEEYENVFTYGTTSSINSLAYAWGLQNLKQGDEIVLTIMEHHSNMIPWQFFLKRGIKIHYADIDENGELMMDQFQDLVNKKTKVVSVAHTSNLLGTINDVKRIGKIAHDAGALFVVDGAQAVPHMDVNLNRIDADFYAFSGHKMLGPTGIGALVGKTDILKKTDPFMFGGSMMKETHTTGCVWADPPEKFEAGTPNIAGAVGFAAAVDYLKKIGMDNVMSHGSGITRHVLSKLPSGIKTYGPADIKKRNPVISFSHDKIDAHEIASILDNNGIAIRSGHHCAQPLTERLGVKFTARVSFYIYNTKKEADIFLDSLSEVVNKFG